MSINEPTPGSMSANTMVASSQTPAASVTSTPPARQASPEGALF